VKVVELYRRTARRRG